MEKNDMLARALGNLPFRRNVRAREFTTFRIGGPVTFFTEPKDADELCAMLSAARSCDYPVYIIGNGSNLLVSDSGVEALFIRIGARMAGVGFDGTRLKCGAGALLCTAAKAAVAEGLAGLEWAAGIPGTVGGAVAMNAGAYGGEMKDILVSVDAVTPDGTVRTFDVEELGLGYRTSIFTKGGYVIVGALMRLHRGSYDDIKACMDELAYKRRLKQPLEYPSAGSTFKRPEGMFAGQLIEESGLKGRGVGDACVSDKHAGFVINKGKASAKDIYDTIQLVISEVKKQKGVILEPEVRIIGEF